MRISFYFTSFFFFKSFSSFNSYQLNCFFLSPQQRDFRERKKKYKIWIMTSAKKQKKMITNLIRKVNFVCNVLVKRCWRVSNPSRRARTTKIFDFWGVSERGRTNNLLVFVFCFENSDSEAGKWVRDALPLITTCNQIVSKFLNYGSSLLRLNGFFVGWDDNSCEDKLKF